MPTEHLLTGEDMADKEQKNIRRCARCGLELNDFTARRIPLELRKELMADYSGEPEYSCLCLDCQQSRYNAIAAATSPQLAIFYCCMAFDAPFDIEAVDKTGEAQEAWKAYCDNLRLKNLDEEDGNPLGFLDGVTDITKIFGANLSAGEFNKAVGIELSARKKKPGTARQREKWGVGSPKNPLTTEDYNELDAFYDALSVDIDMPDAKQEHILKLCSQLSLDMEKARIAEQFDKVKKISATIQENLRAENLRKVDAKPMEDVRIDSIVDRLEKAGMLKKGKLAEPDVIFERLFGRPPKYAYTADAADQVIKIIWNRMQNNDGMPELQELPDDMRIDDALCEFAAEQDDTEKANYEKLGLIKMPPKKGDG